MECIACGEGSKFDKCNHTYCFDSGRKKEVSKNAGRFIGLASGS